MRGFGVRVIGVFSFILLFSVGASADEYVTFKSLKKDVKQAWAKQADATYPLQFVGNVNCSTVVVGPNGEALTNLHCVEKCLEANKIVSEEPLAGTKLRKVLIDQTKLPVTCKLRFDKQKNEEKEAEILHVFGPGWILERDDFVDFMNEFQEEYLKLTAQGFESGGDLVLIRLPMENSPCVRLGQADFKSIDPVDLVSISYPMVFRVDDLAPYPGAAGSSFFAMGMTQLWSTGQASANIETLSKNVDPFYVQYLDLMTTSSLIISTTDTEPGASGSPLFNTSGELVAITRSTWKGPTSKYVPWTSGAIDLTPHKKWIEDNVSNIGKCQ